MSNSNTPSPENQPATTGASSLNIDRESREILKYISEDFVMLASGTKLVAYHIETGDELGKDGMRQYCAKHYGKVVMTVIKEGNETEKEAPAGDIWWEWNDPLRRVVRRIVMEPTSKGETDDNPEVFNRWHILKHTMAERNPQATANDIAILANHLMYLSGDDVVGVTFFLCWLAQLYQTPEIKMPTAVYLYSKYGRVGKNLMQRLLTRVFGKPLVAGCTGKQLQKNFDDAIEHKRLVFINELARSEKVDGYENFKSQISEEFTQFEGKGRASKEIRNITHFIITSNHGDGLPLMENDGRICVLQCLEPRKDDAYYDELVDWIDGPGASALAQILATWRFPAIWKPHAPVPQTAATRAMQEASRGALHNNMEQLRLAGAAPFDRDILAVLDVTQALHGYEAMWGCKINTTSVGIVLKRMFGEPVPMKVEREPPAKDKVVPTMRVYLQPSGIDWTKATPKQRGENLNKGTRLFTVQPPDDYPKTEVSDNE
ncbi:primase-helicase family protein [Pseudomonas sp. GL-RE-20]|uniref:primase-helicase family protein n=1 Tax=Pseudomonas sp. GL-RE-20 TaxID=2832372 RepID=UPI001CBE838A|nr:primase-helicase family protein [Pseudomonas sp. GL-RE-20]